MFDTQFLRDDSAVEAVFGDFGRVCIALRTGDVFDDLPHSAGGFKMEAGEQENKFGVFDWYLLLEIVANATHSVQVGDFLKSGIECIGVRGRAMGKGKFRV